VLEAADLPVALGGDGTVLAALRAAAEYDVPVLGVSCGSLGALTATSADELPAALDRVRAGDWSRRSVPALSIATSGGEHWAFNDFVVVRRGPGQLLAELEVDGELYVRLAGDGLVVATPLGSSAYTMAAGGPILAGGTAAIVCTPLAMHGGHAPPLVVPADATVTVTVKPSFAGYQVEIDGRRQTLEGERFELRRHEHKVTLVMFGAPDRGLTALRRRGLITDSARVVARDAREHTRGPGSGASSSDLAAADRQEGDAL
jgi:NAD+ kinase